MNDTGGRTTGCKLNGILLAGPMPVVKKSDSFARDVTESTNVRDQFEK